MIREDVRNINISLKKEGLTFNGKAVLVTGGAGFLGSWICSVLIEQGAKVTCLDNLASGLASNIKPLKDRDNFTFVQHDISKPITFDKSFDLVMHLASRASPFEFER